MKRGQPLKRTGWMRRSKKPLRRKSSNRMTPWRNKKYRDAGKGLPCVNCGGNADTVCGRHIRLVGFCGTGLKPADFLLADLCDVCDRDYGELNRADDAAVVMRMLAWTLKRRCELGFLGEGD